VRGLAARPLLARQPAEADRPHVALRARPGVVRVDADAHRLDRLGRLLAVEALEVLEDVAALGNPPTEIGRTGPHDHIADHARARALDDLPGRRRAVPHIADDPRADRRGKTREDHVVPPSRWECRRGPGAARSSPPPGWSPARSQRDSGPRPTRSTQTPPGRGWPRRPPPAGRSPRVVLPAAGGEPHPRRAEMLRLSDRTPRPPARQPPGAPAHSTPAPAPRTPRGSRGKRRGSSSCFACCSRGAPPPCRGTGAPARRARSGAGTAPSGPPTSPRSGRGTRGRNTPGRRSS
jgi:hypothetical protein